MYTLENRRKPNGVKAEYLGALVYLLVHILWELWFSVWTSSSGPKGCVFESHQERRNVSEQTIY